MKKIKKLCGVEEVIVNHKEYCAKYLIFKEGYFSSLHFHKKKKETFMVVYGELELLLNNKILRLTEYEPITIMPKEQHMAQAINGDCCVLEISTHHSDKDVVRLIKSRKI